jgi:ubiquinone/menaquinone biosynthesis C-methylase UbiE
MTTPAPALARHDSSNQPEQDRLFWQGQWQTMRTERSDSDSWFNDRDGMLMDVIRPNLPSTGTIAELGCGSGRLLARIGRERPGVRLVAVDRDDSTLRSAQASAREYGVPIETKLDDVNDLSFLDDSFEMVLSEGYLEHFAHPRTALREMVRTLKPGGTLYATVVPRKQLSLHEPTHRWFAPAMQRAAYDAYTFAKWLGQLGMVEVIPLTMGVYPPLFRHLAPTPRRLIERTMRSLDGTPLADLLGYFFVLGARKRA